MTDLEILSKNIKRYRLLRGLSQTELASKIEMSGDYFSKVELGKQDNIGLKYLILISRELDIGMDELFMENGSEASIKFVVAGKNYENFEKLLNLIAERVSVKFKQDPNEPVFYHRKNCACVKCREKRDEK